jgi:hypothetical protein
MASGLTQYLQGRSPRPRNNRKELNIPYREYTDSCTTMSVHMTEPLLVRFAHRQESVAIHDHTFEHERMDVVNG